MALIPCPDCGTSISDAAPQCIKCGRPMGTAAAGKPVTIQQTAKKYKGQQLLAALVCSVGVVMMIGENTMSGAGVFLLGLVWYFAARAGAWWSNG